MKAGKNSDIVLFVDSSQKGMEFIGFMEDIRTALNKDVDLFDNIHIEKGSFIDSEIAGTGVTIYEK